MTLKSLLDKISGLRHLVSGLELQSGLAKSRLYNTTFLKDTNAIQTELDATEAMLRELTKPENHDRFTSIKIKLAQINDIRGSLQNLESSATLDDIELFEIKKFSLLSEEIRELLDIGKINIIKLTGLSSVIRILDPDNARLPNFYVYDSYSEELARLRSSLKTKKLELVALQSTGNQKRIEETEKQISDFFLQSIEIEDTIRNALSAKLKEETGKLNRNLELAAYLDILIAKAGQANKLQLQKPAISDDDTLYEGLFNPQVKEILQAKNEEFQPVDITLQPAACLITGANMTGKTVLLKTIALAQYLFQFGFFVPAKTARIAVVEDILVSIGDEQSELNGLSSYAAEILNISDIIQKIKTGKRYLVLIDELARTTNPTEGKAIVNATLDILSRYRASSLITTHYSGIESDCRKLRVKGFIEGKASGKVTKENIMQFIDYSLVEETLEQVPQEAIHIAEILGIDEELVEKAKGYLKS